MEKNTDVIRSVAYSQHEIIENIDRLYLGGRGFDLDITYSEGKFYGEKTFTDISGVKRTTVIPQPRNKCDVAPMTDGITKIDPWGALPFGDGSMKSVMFDPPFVISPRTCDSVISGKDGACKIFNRFSGYYPVNELLDSYNHFLKECYRVLEDGGYMVFKCQPTVTGGRELNSHHFIWLIAESVGFDVVDEFVLVSKQRLISGKVKTQKHARKFHSYFMVLRKDVSKKIPCLNFMTDDEAEATLGGFMARNLGKKNGENLRYREDPAPQTHIMGTEERMSAGRGSEGSRTEEPRQDGNGFPDIDSLF